MYYRTRTYLAGDWDGDHDLIQTVLDWNKSGYLTLDFSDAHELTQSRDSSLHCSIKRSLATRLEASKTFILIVGEHTNTITKGSCKDCKNYSAYFQKCNVGRYVDYRSFVKFECDLAAKNARDGKLRIAVVYNAPKVNKNQCPEVLQNLGEHVPGLYIDNSGKARPHYQNIKNIIMG